MSGYTQEVATGFISFVLPYDAQPEQALAAIAAIQKHYNLTAPAAPAADAPAPAAPVAPAADAPSIDSKGLPWDERIHSSSKGLNADGTWRNRKNVPPTVRSKVEAELRGVVSAPAPLAQPSLPLPPSAPAPVAPVAPSAYSELVQFLAEHTHSEANPSGRLTVEWIASALTAYGVPGGDLQNLAHNEDLTKTVHAAVKQALGL